MTKNFAITIGINKYEHIDRPLNYAASDAEKVRDFLVQLRKCHTVLVTFLIRHISFERFGSEVQNQAGLHS